MNILIDGHCVGDKSGGNETYWKNLIYNINNVDNANDYTVFHSKDISLELKNTNHRTKSFYSNNTIWRNLVSLPMHAHLSGFDAIHTQYFLPAFTGKKAVVTIHDISFEHYPECFSKKDLIVNKKLIRQAAEKARAIITVSNFSKSDIANTYGINPDKIFVTHLGANDELYNESQNPEEVTKVKKKYKIYNNFILVVGNLQPRKNLTRLIEAFKILKKNKTYNNYKLVIVGKKAWANNGIINGVDIKDIENDIILTGYVPDEELPYLYKGCDVFVYPSIFEGFGLPVLEAMKCGAAVAASNISSIPEVVGDGGLLFDPFNVADISNTISLILDNAMLKESLKIKGLKRSQHFSWINTAKETISVYEYLKQPEK